MTTRRRPAGHFTAPTRDGRCVCGLLVRYHFTHDNRSLTCDEARHLHPRAHRLTRSLSTLLKEIRRHDQR